MTTFFTALKRGDDGPDPVGLFNTFEDAEAYATWAQDEEECEYEVVGIASQSPAYVVRPELQTPKEEGTAMSERDDMEASVARQEERLATATKLAIASYGSDDLEIIEREDDFSNGWFVQSVDGGYWVEARVFIDAQEVEDHIAEGAPDEVTLRYVVPVDVIVNVPDREVRRVVVLDDSAKHDPDFDQQTEAALEIAEVAGWPGWEFGY